MQSEGFETVFSRDFNQDGNIGELVQDQNADGLVDGSNEIAYQLFDNGSAINLLDDKGERFSDSTSPEWNLIQATKTDHSTPWRVLVEGTNSQRNLFQVWNVNANGMHSGASNWLDGRSMQQQGHEHVLRGLGPARGLGVRLRAQR